MSSSPAISSTSPGQNDGNVVAIVLGALAAVLVAAYVVLELNGRDVGPYLAFASGPAVSALVGALLARRTAALAQDVAVVRYQTDGVLTQALTAASVERQAIAQDSVADRVRVADALAHRQSDS